MIELGFQVGCNDGKGHRYVKYNIDRDGVKKPIKRGLDLQCIMLQQPYDDVMRPYEPTCEYPKSQKSQKTQNILHRIFWVIPILVSSSLEGDSLEHASKIRMQRSGDIMRWKGVG